MASQDESAYQPKDALSDTVQTTMIVGGAGVFVSAIQNTLTRQPNVTGWGVITRTGGTIALFGTQPQRPPFSRFPRTHSLIEEQRRLAEHLNSLGQQRRTYARRTTPGTRR
ncbi:MAG: hypothetical protein Q9224_000892 [Gallowayella concinna]